MGIKAGDKCPQCKDKHAILQYTGRDKKHPDNFYQRILKCSNYSCEWEVLEEETRRND